MSGALAAGEGLDLTSPLMLVAIALLVDGALVTWGVLRSRRRIRAIGDPSVLSCGAGADHVGREVWIRGSAAPGAAGPVKSRLSGSECVWFTSRTVEYGPSFWGPPSPKASGRPDWQRSSAPFVLRDSSGEVAVSPDGLTLGSSPASQLDEIRADRLVKTVDEFDKNRRFRKRGVGGWRREEWILPKGADVYIRGILRMSEGGLVLEKPPSGNFLLTLVAPIDEVRSEKALVRILILLVSPLCLALTYCLGLVVQLV
ncbi:hypothetical protein GCM10010191_44670 [Actinomadura vinacea]|uniref:RING-type E3 ubiquitin transferase n=1 Tax=Actinomadura vinacea TaxID=115336 RepID=A0ABN3JCC1_9ACTN